MTAHHERRGAGPPLVLIHGIGHRWQAWEPVLDLLAGHHDVIAIDLPGFGRSPVPSGGLPGDMAGTTTWLATFVASLGLHRPHIAGNSLGGAIALEAAARGLVSSATALSPAGFFTPAQARRALRILGVLRATTFQPKLVLERALSQPRLLRRTFGALMEHPERLSAERLIGDALALRGGAGFRLVARAVRDYQFAGPVEVPVTIGWGSADRILPPEQSERARRVLPHARHVTLAGCGHVPMSDDPEAVAGLILQTTRAAPSPSHGS